MLCPTLCPQLRNPKRPCHLKERPPESSWSQERPRGPGRGLGHGEATLITPPQPTRGNRLPPAGRLLTQARALLGAGPGWDAPAPTEAGAANEPNPHSHLHAGRGCVCSRTRGTRKTPVCSRGVLLPRRSVFCFGSLRRAFLKRTRVAGGVRFTGAMYV